MVEDHDLAVPDSGLHLKAPETPLKARLLSRKEAFEILETTNDREGNIWFVTVTLNREDRRGTDTEVTIEGFPDVYQKFKKPLDWNPTTEELRQLALSALEKAIDKARANPD